MCTAEFLLVFYWKPINAGKFGNDISILTPLPRLFVQTVGIGELEEIPKHTYLLAYEFQRKLLKKIFEGFFFSLVMILVMLRLVNILTGEFVHKNYAACILKIVYQQLNSSFCII